MQVLPYGREAILVELDDPALVLPCRRAVAALPGVLEAVPGARTVLVRCGPADLARLTSQIEILRVTAEPRGEDAGPVVELRVRYDGTDLDEVARQIGLSRAEVIERHSRSTYVVRFCGFSPGFSYLDGLDAALHLPRLGEPRPSVPAGSVAIAGEFSAVYPRSSPGGWRLLGTTADAIWDAAALPPARLTPGTRVRFVAS